MFKIIVVPIQWSHEMFKVIQDYVKLMEYKIYNKIRIYDILISYLSNRKSERGESELKGLNYK